MGLRPATDDGRVGDRYGVIAGCSTRVGCACSVPEVKVPWSGLVPSWLVCSHALG